MNETRVAAATEVQPQDSVDMSVALPADNIELNVALGSRKKLLQRLADLVSTGHAEIDPEMIFKILVERERLGSTGIGEGIAVPHGRVEGLTAPALAVVRLQHAIDFDAPDDKPVWLAICLLVPGDANDTHLKLLARLASQFKQEGFLDQVRTDENIELLHQRFMKI